MRILVGCGAARGHCRHLQRPGGGHDVRHGDRILADFAVATFSPIVLSAVMATAISRFYLGDFPAFVVPAYQLVSAWELILYAGLGLAAGAVGAAFSAVLYKTEDLVDAIRIPEYLKTPLAGLALGAMGMAFPWVLGVGYEGIELALHHQLVWWMMLIIVGAKILATSLTIAGGMSGGIFAPSLVIGAMLGGSMGGLAHELWPGMTAGPGAYAIVAWPPWWPGPPTGPSPPF